MNFFQLRSYFIGIFIIGLLISYALDIKTTEGRIWVVGIVFLIALLVIALFKIAKLRHIKKTKAPTKLSDYGNILVLTLKNDDIELIPPWVDMIGEFDEAMMLEATKLLKKTVLVYVNKFPKSKIRVKFLGEIPPCMRKLEKRFKGQVSIMNSTYYTDNLTTPPENPYKTLIEKGIEAYTDAVTSLSWFKEKNEQKQQEVLDGIKKVQDINYVFLTLAEHWFDSEWFEGADNYRGLIQDIINIAGVQSAIKNISVTKEDSSINIAVETEHKTLTYAVDTNEHAGWIDEQFIPKFINERLLPAVGSGKIIYEFPPIDQCGLSICISKDELETAQRIGVIPVNLDFISKN